MSERCLDGPLSGQVRPLRPPVLTFPALKLPHSKFLEIIIVQVERWKVPHLAPFSTEKHAAVLAALKVPRPLHGAIVLPCGLVERDTDPETDAWDLGDGTGVGDCSSSRVGFGEDAYAGAESDSCWAQVSRCAVLVERSLCMCVRTRT
jgi:hypothetical protein